MGDMPTSIGVWVEKPSTLEGAEGDRGWRSTFNAQRVEWRTDGHGTVCHVWSTQVTDMPCMHAVSPAVVS